MNPLTRAAALPAWMLTLAAGGAEVPMALAGVFLLVARKGSGRSWARTLT